MRELRELLEQKSQKLEERLLQMSRSEKLIDPTEISNIAMEMAEIRGERAAFDKKQEILNHLLHEEARTDTLTGLPNRRDFTEKLTLEFSLLRRYEREPQSGQIERMLSVLHVDLDHFKQINDTYGHEAGDRYLRIAAEHMKAALSRESDIIGRMGGDEFAIVVITKDAEGVERVAAHIKQAVLTASTAAKRELEKMRGISLPEDEGNISASVGYATLEDRDRVPKELLERADYAGYVAKKGGKDAVASYYFARALDDNEEMYRMFMNEKNGASNPEVTVS